LSVLNNAFRPESSPVRTRNDTGLVDPERSGSSLGITGSVASYERQLASDFDVKERKGPQQAEVEKGSLSVADRVVGFGHEGARATESVVNVGECGEGPQNAEIEAVATAVDGSSQKSQQRGENGGISSLSSEKDVSLLSLSTELEPIETSFGSVDEDLDEAGCLAQSQNADAQSAAKPKECSAPESWESGLH